MKLSPTTSLRNEEVKEVERDGMEKGEHGSDVLSE